MQKYLGAVAARPRAGFARDVMVGGANLILTWVVTAPKCPPRYIIGIRGQGYARCNLGLRIVPFILTTYYLNITTPFRRWPLLFRRVFKAQVSTRLVQRVLSRAFNLIVALIIHFLTLSCSHAYTNLYRVYIQYYSKQH